MKAGDKVVCIKEGKWELEFGIFDERPINFPVKDEIYIIDKVDSSLSGTFLHLKGCGKAGFWSKWFRPLDYDFVEEVLKNIKPQPVEA